MASIPTLSFGLVNGRPVFMDDLHDSYFLLEAKDEAQFLEALERSAHSSASSIEAPEPFAIAPDQRLIVEANPPRAASSLLDLWDQQDAPRPWRDFLSVAVLQYRVRTDLARRSIVELLSLHSIAPMSRLRPKITDPIADLSLRYLDARGLLPFRGNCLVDTLALARWLAPAAGLLIVFGVKLDPFAAHCWAQLDELILNDRRDHVAPFTPVRVIECAPALH